MKIKSFDTPWHGLKIGGDKKVPKKKKTKKPETKTEEQCTSVTRFNWLLTLCV